MLSQSGVVDFKVELKIVHQIVLPQESNHCGGIKIILVFGWFHGFGLNEKVAGETLFSRIVFHHVQKGSKMIQLLLHVGI